MLPGGFGEDGGRRVKDFVGDRLDEGHGDHTDGVRLGQLLHHHWHLYKIPENRDTHREVKGHVYKHRKHFLSQLGLEHRKYSI